MPNMVFDGNDVIGKSWYHLIHWEDIQAARKLHSQSKILYKYIKKYWVIKIY
jgi:hypothetical protein